MGILLFVLPCVCPFFFLSKFFVKDISTTVLDRNFIFGIQVHNDKLYCGIVNGHSPICSSLCLSLFLSFQIFRQRYLHNHLRYKLQIWYTGPQGQVVSWDCQWALSYLFFLLFVPFSFFPNFSSKVSPQPFKIETSYLGYRFTTTSCIVGLKVGLLLFVLLFICSFFFLSTSFVKDISTTV